MTRVLLYALKLFLSDKLYAMLYDVQPTEEIT
jgi:hypothetical protein